jgi:hypothetical protein
MEEVEQRKVNRRSNRSHDAELEEAYKFLALFSNDCGDARDQ